MLGTGTQLFCVVFLLLALSLLGIYSPSNRGALMTSGIVFFSCLGGVAGYYSARLNALYGAQKRRSLALRTAMIFPGTFFVMFFVLDLLIFSQVLVLGQIFFESMH